MPVFNHDKLGRVLFIHVPKTGGSSIEKWLIDAGFELEKLHYWAGDQNQHATREVYRQWGHFDYKFMVVRHPFKRFISALAFKTVNGDVADKTARNILHNMKSKHAHKLMVDWGNHFQPQVDFLDEDVEVFRYENDFFSQIDSILNVGPPYPHTNKAKSALTIKHFTPELINAVNKLYAEDYETFGYEIQT